MTSSDPVLEQLFEQYCQATDRAAAPAAPAEAVTALLRSRVALYEHLVATGWDPPREAERQIGLDVRAMTSAGRASVPPAPPDAAATDAVVS